MHADPSRLLRLTFTVNAVSTAATGLAFLAGGRWLGPLLGLAPVVLAVLGAAFVAFGLHLSAVLRQPEISRGQALYFALLDSTYVAGSVVLLLGWPQLLSSIGRLVFALLADVVAVFAIAEFVGYRRLSGLVSRTA